MSRYLEGRASGPGDVETFENYQEELTVTKMSKPTQAYPYTGCGGRHKVPAAVKEAARKGLAMHQTGFKGGTRTGWSRAKQLINCDYVTDRTIKTMKAWFARHSHTSQPGYRKWVSAGKPTTLTSQNKGIYRGAVAWLIWGGDPAYSWVQGITPKV